MSWEQWSTQAAEDPALLARIVYLAYGDADRAADALSEAILRSRNACNDATITSWAHYRNWVQLVARRRLIDTSRNGSLQAPLNIDPVEPQPDESHDARLQRVREAVQACLSEDERQLLQWYFEGGLTYQQTAEQQGCSLSTTYAHMQKALARLRAHLLKTDPDLFLWLERRRPRPHGRER